MISSAIRFTFAAPSIVSQHPREHHAPQTDHFLLEMCREMGPGCASKVDPPGREWQSLGMGLRLG